MTSVTFLSPRLIRASAGSGKTFELSSRYIGLLARGEKPERILATTFTRKAAGEIQERVFRRLAEAALSEDRARELAESVKLPSLSRQQALQILRRLIASQHRLNICTLDSFFVSIAQSFALELGLPAQWRIPDSYEEAGIVRRAVASLCRRAESSKTAQLLRLLNSDNLSRSVHQSMVLQAGEFYETFKCTTAQAWDWLKVSKGLEKEQLRGLLESLRAVPAPQTKGGTADKTWSKKLQSLVRTVENEDWKALLDDSLVERVLKDEPVFNRHAIPAELVDIISRFSRHGSSVLFGRIAGHNRAAREVLGLYDREFKEERSLSRTLNFSEIKELLSGAALGERLQELYYRLDSQIAHLLFDEFQDTSMQEWLVLKPVVAEILSQSEGDQSFFCVGDVKQAIYGWRGGVADIFDSLQSTWQQLLPESRETSWRCRPAVVETVNTVFSGLLSNAALSEHPAAAARWQERFSKHSSSCDQSITGYVRLEGVGSSEEDDIERPVLHRAALLVKETAARYPSLSVGVLVRRNEAVARMIEELSEVSPEIEASEEGGNPLTDSVAVEAVLSLLTLIDHPGDSVALFCVKTSALSEHAELKGIEDRSRIPAISVELRKKLLDAGYGAFIFEFAEMLLPHSGPRDAQRLMQLVELAYSRDMEATSRPLDFVEFVRKEKVEYTSSARVRVMTVHKAKGLEFDVVILPELDQGLLRNLQRGLLEYRKDLLSAPLRVSGYVSEALRLFSPELQEMYGQTAAARVEESLSLLYVAMTRARFGLYLLIRSVKSESKVPLTYSAVLAQALCGGRRETGCLYECGSEDLSQAEAQSRKETERQEVETIVVPDKLLQSSRTKRRRGFIRQTPSELEGGALVDLRLALRLDGGESAGRGMILHALFEKVEWLDDGAPSDDSLKQVVAGAELIGLDRAELLAEFRSMLACKEIALALSREAFKKWNADELMVQRERRFVMREEDAIVNGAFDRLIIGQQAGKAVACEVMDFKTDILPESDITTLNNRAEYYRPQLEAYRKAAARITGLPLEKISARLLFVSAGISFSLTEN